MRRVNNGTWMLAVLVVISLVVPGVVAARQQVSMEPAPASAGAADLVEPALAAELGAEADPAAGTDPAVGTCFNRTCTTSAQCKTWCDEPSAMCAPQASPPHFKRCFLP
jgi:hypothetical protein